MLQCINDVSSNPVRENQHFSAQKFNSDTAMLTFQTYIYIYIYIYIYPHILERWILPIFWTTTTLFFKKAPTHSKYHFILKLHELNLLKWPLLTFSFK